MKNDYSNEGIVIPLPDNKTVDTTYPYTDYKGLTHVDSSFGVNYDEDFIVFCGVKYLPESEYAS